MRLDDQEDHNFYATLKTPGGELRRVLCRLWLPKRPTERVRMVFYPTQEQADALPPDLNPFSVRGRKTELPGNVTSIRASRVWADTVPSRSLSKNRMETVFEADPIDLQVFTTGREDLRRRRRKLAASITYLLAPSSHELSPFTIVKRMGTGTIHAKTVRRFAFTLRGKRRLTFKKHYHYQDRDSADETVEWRDLVATEKREMDRTTFARVDMQALEDLDDFLVLVSFSSRHRVVCVGLEAYTEAADHFQFFRKNVTVPRKKDQDFDEAVVDLAEFGEFIRVAYRRFIQSGPDDLLRHALHLVMPRENQTVESSYTTLYAALETIVLWHRQHTALENIIEDEKAWNKVRDNIGDFLKTQAVLQDDKEKRRMMRLKLGELRRVPFSIAFENFCTTYSVDLSDLWPVIGKEKEMPLSTIRNHIVHGSALDRSQLSGLFEAREHLRWTVERMLLAILGWPVERSKVRHDFLLHFTAMVNLSAARRAMQKLPELPHLDTERESGTIPPDVQGND